VIKVHPYRGLGKLALLVVLMLSLAACGGTPPTNTPVPAPTTAPPTATSVALAAAPTATAAGETATPGATDTAGAPTAPAAAGATDTAGAPTAPATAGGTTQYMADLGFRPQANGFSFQNYAGKYPETPGNLTLDDVRKMFGDASVCAQVQADTCTPVQDAVLWLDQMNKMANGGSCYGFSIVSLLLFKGQEKPADYGNGTKAFDLALDGNAKLRRNIAYYMTLQAVQPVAATWQQIIKQKTPADILDLLAEQIKSGTDIGALIFFQAGKGGHAVTPYAIEDRGNGIFWIHVYDNNYPGQDKYIEINRTANTWTYALAALNPAEDAAPWGGDATTGSIGLSPLSAHTASLVCPWCRSATGSGQAPGGLAPLLAAPQVLPASWPLRKPPTGQVRQVWLNGAGHLLIKDPAGHEIGFDNGKLVNTMPDANVESVFGSALFATQEPAYDLPEGAAYDVLLDGPASGSGADGFALFGEGASAEINNVNVDQSTQDHLMLSGDGTKVGFKANEEEKPDLKMTVDKAGHSYAIDVNGLDLSSGDEIDLTADEATGRLDLHDTGKQAEKYDLTVTEVDPSGEHSFAHKGIDLQTGATDDIEFGNWNGQDPLPVGVDTNSDGTIDQTVTEDNQP